MKFQIIKKWQWFVVGGGYVAMHLMYIIHRHIDGTPTLHFVGRLATAFFEPGFALFWGSMLIVSLIRWIRYRRSEI